MGLELEMEHQETPSPANPEGFRGIGESGTIPVAAAVCSAIEDALRRSGVGIELTEVPVTPERLFDLISAGAAGVSR